MKRALRALAVTVMLICCFVLTVSAGWWRNKGRTEWTARPTPATCWARDVAQDLRVLTKVEVYNTTIRHYTDGGDTVAATNHALNTGFWTVDSVGDPRPHADLSAAYCTTNTGHNARFNSSWYDVEWECDGVGDLIPKL